MANEQIVEKKRIIDMTERTTVTDDVYIATDEASVGTRKYQLSRITGEVSDLKEDLNDNIGLVDYMEWGNGYFGTDGSVNSQSGTNYEKYTVNYIPVISEEEWTLTITLSGGKAQWARWIFYDIDKNVIGYGVKNQTWTQSITIPINVPKMSAYMRVSFRSFNDVSIFDLSRNDGLVSIVGELEEKIPKKTGDFISICHQGYSKTDSSGHNLLAGYPLAAKMGFDYGECDLKLTSDGELVCCHDGSFIDQTTQETITISQKTLSELQTYNYYGGTIASFDEIVKTCKESGLGLCIDQIAYDNCFKVFPIVKKYAMQNRVKYILIYNETYPGLITELYNTINNSDPNAQYMIIPQTRNIINDVIALCNNLNSDTNTIELYLNYGVYSTSDILTYQEQLDSDINVAVWTIDYLPTCKEYLPYVTGICSNKISSNYLF